MKTIIYIGGFQLPDKNAAAHRVINNGKILKSLGYKVVFIGVQKENTNAIEYPTRYQDFDIWEYKYPRRFKNWIKYLTTITCFKKVLEEYSEVEAVICYNFPSISMKKIIDYSKKRNIKVISDVTEWYGVQGDNLITKCIKGLDSFYRMRILNKKVDGVIAISNYLMDYYKPRVNTILVPPLVDLNEKKWSISNRKSKGEQLIFTYIGSPGFKKDKINVIIKAFSNLSSNEKFKLLIIGIKKAAYLNMYPKDDVILNQCKESIIFLGERTHIESITYLLKSDYSIFYRKPNIITKAGFPTKFVESITCGIPVITNDIGSISDYLVDGVNGFYMSSDSLKEKLAQIIRTDCKDLKGKFDKTVFDYRKYTTIFESLMNGKKR